MESRACKRCGIDKELTEYYTQNKKRKDGSKYIYYNPECKECTTKAASKWVDSNRERHNQNQLKYFKTEKGKEAQHRELATWRNKGGYRQYYQNNKDKFIEYAKTKKEHKTHDITDEEWFACLDYFKRSCAYCGLPEVDQLNNYNHQFHREHVYTNGNNYIDNCVPSCTKCNVSKRDIEFNDWYNEDNKVFSKRRYNKIVNWMTKECFKVLNLA
jgi:hypothetical protein